MWILTGVGQEKEDILLEGNPEPRVFKNQRSNPVHFLILVLHQESSERHRIRILYPAPHEFIW